MTSFKFNFMISNDDEKQPIGENVVRSRQSNFDDNVPDLTFEKEALTTGIREIHATDDHLITADEYKNESSCKGLKRRLLVDDEQDEDSPKRSRDGHVGSLVYYLPASIGENQSLTNVTARLTANSTSDLIPGVYEGGFKVWECTEDLLMYINENIQKRLQHKRVLDLGCGVGLVGILSLHLGATEVHFQDYNKEVMDMVTVPNVSISCGERALESVRFFAGDWKSLCTHLGAIAEDDKYDFIFTSETIYNPANYPALFSAFQHCIKQDGEIYVAAKSVYFGVGGSVQSFMSFCESTSALQVLHCKTITAGVNRQILRLKLSTSSAAKPSPQKMRKPYRPPNDAFTEHDLITKEPIGQFRRWFNAAREDASIPQPNAMCLATSTKSGIPSARMVLLKGYGDHGFDFYTNYRSRKGEQLLENPFASLCFYWEPHDRQVRVDGRVEKLTAEDGKKYFQERPRPSQISAAISEQSSVVKREELLKRYEAMCTEYDDETVPIPKPDSWGGFRIVPNVIEFFQGQTNRLHDRIRFRRPLDGEILDNEYAHPGENGWMYERLAP